MALHGSCHCGRVGFDLQGDIKDVIDCNCSMCRRRGGLLAFFPRDALTLTTKEGDYGTYRFRSGRIAHHFCLGCGISTFSEGVDPRSGAMTACVNVRCLPDVELSTLNVKAFDGAGL